MQDALTPNFLAGKNNMIWGMNYLKATSTYQNGNLFGANLLLIGFAVIANYITDKKKIIVPMTLLAITVLLTASASVYLGMAAAVIWMVFFSRNRNSASIIAVFFGGLFLAIIAIAILSTDNIFSQLIYERVLNRDLSAGGGRMEKINDYVEHISQTPWLLINGMLFYNKPFLEVYEILPVQYCKSLEFLCWHSLWHLLYQKFVYFFHLHIFYPLLHILVLLYRMVLFGCHLQQQTSL
ncbi:hypothetical protein LNO02_19445 [Klebsiella variicola subsp. variicola]|nr:hypothetical protein [Klebsiella variicola subsp. variicola]